MALSEEELTSPVPPVEGGGSPLESSPEGEPSETGEDAQSAGAPGQAAGTQEPEAPGEVEPEPAAPYPYATLDDMLTRFGQVRLTQLTRAEPGAGEPGESKVAAALRDAAELVDGHVAARYKTPLKPVPAPIRRYTADIALYYLHAALGNVPEAVRKAYEDALAGLRDIAKGLVILQCEGLASEEKTAAGGIVMAVPERLFTPESLKGF